MHLSQRCTTVIYLGRDGNVGSNETYPVNPKRINNLSRQGLFLYDYCTLVILFTIYRLITKKNAFSKTFQN